VSGPINNKQQDLLEITQRNIERLGLLANDVLDIHKLESGQMKLDLDDHDVSEVVQEVHKTMDCAASKKEIHLMVEKEGRLARAHVDRDKIVQVLTNLLSNAIKFTPDGGRITTRLQQENGHLRIQVTDTGIGIPAKHLPSIFDRFFQVQELYQQTKGSGLGLSIVKNIVELHGGTVQVESEVDKGTTFTIVLPLRMNTELENESKSADIILEHIMSE
jgi:signal transduction histidine kinase